MAHIYIWSLKTFKFIAQDRPPEAITTQEVAAPIAISPSFIYS